MAESRWKRARRAAGTGLALGILMWVAWPALAAFGDVLLLPPLYRPAARLLLAALWLVSVAAAWAYRPSSGSGAGRPDEPR